MSNVEAFYFPPTFWRCFVVLISKKKQPFEFGPVTISYFLGHVDDGTGTKIGKPIWPSPPEVS